MPSIHKAVLLHEVVEGLLKVEGKDKEYSRKGLSERDWRESETRREHEATACPDEDVPYPDRSIIYLDGTLGGAGHARAMLKAFGGKRIGPLRRAAKNFVAAALAQQHGDAGRSASPPLM